MGPYSDATAPAGDAHTDHASGPHAAAPRPNRRNHYRLLHVQPEAPLEVIKASYRTLMTRMRMHPDLGGTHEEAARINEAYAVLSDPQRRADYDRILKLRARHDALRHAGGRPQQANPSFASRTASPGAAAHSSNPSAAAASALHRYAQTQAATAGTTPSMSASRMPCCFCGSGNPLSGSPSASCLRCGAPLTPVRILSMPTFRGAGLNRRASVRRTRHHEAVAYWGSPPKRHLVRWRDLSATGLSVWSPSPLSPGQRLHLMDAEIQTVAEVVDCEAAGAGSMPGWLLRARMLTLRPLRRSGLFYSDQA